jgi:hypothetical protein
MTLMKKKKKIPREKTIKWIEKTPAPVRGAKKKDYLKNKRKRIVEDLIPDVEESVPVVKAPTHDPQQLLQELMAGIKDGNTDVLVREMGKYAVGDVVGLGLMSKDQFDEQPEFNDEGEVVRESGRDKALAMIPLKIRAQVLCDMTPYFLAKKSTTNANGSGPKPKVTFYVPENGRPIRDDT